MTRPILPMWPPPKRPPWELTNGVLQVKAHKGWRRYGFRGDGESVDVRIDLPTGSHLRGSVALATLSCTGTLGDCRYKTGGSDIAVEEVAGAAEFTTGTGAIRIGRVGGPAVVKNGNGDTVIGEAAELQVKAANGDIVVHRAHAPLTAKTANGDVRLDEVTTGLVVAETACGKVEVGVRPGVAAWLDLHTGFGHVYNLLDATERPGSSDDTVEVRARSSFGDITIRHADARVSEEGAA